MSANFNKRHIVSRRLARKLQSHFRQEVRTIKVIRYPLHSSPQEDIGSNLNPNREDNPNTNANPKVTTRWFTLRLSGILIVTFIKIDHASNYVHFCSEVGNDLFCSGVDDVSTWQIFDFFYSLIC